MEETGSAKLLNIGDNEEWRSSLTWILEQAGFEVMEAATGLDALKLALKLPDLVLLDMNLPDMNGFEVCRLLKSDPTTSAIPILQVSAKNLDSQSPVNGFERWADGYLTQPVDPPILLAHIKALIRSSRLERRLARINRSLKALSYCRHALLRAQSEFELVQEVCRILVEVGGYQFVWVGSGDLDTEKTVRQISKWGDDELLWELAGVSWDETASGGCPMGEAIRTGKPFLIQDIRADSRCEPWRTEALKRGLVSAFGIPLFLGGVPWGAISICSGTAGIFDDEERELLTELAQDLSYGIESLRTREEARKAQKELRESERRYRDLWEKAPVMMISLDLEARITFVSDRFCEVLGYQRDEVLGRRTFEFQTAESAYYAQSVLFPAFLKTGSVKDAPLQLVKKNGDIIDVLLNVTAERDAQDAVVRSRSAFIDVTEHKRAEDLVRQAEQRYRRLFEEAPLMYVITRNELGVPFISDCNQLFLNFLGYSREEVLGKPLANFYSPMSRAKLLEGGGYSRALAGEFYMGERQLVTRDGRLFTTLLHTATEVDPSGNVTGTRAMFADITKLKFAEEVQRRLATAIEQSAEAVLITDTHGVIQYVNPAVERITGFHKEELLGKTPRVFKSGEHDTMFYRHLWNTIRAGHIWSGRITNRTKDGRLYHEEATISPVKDASGRIINFVAVKRDITEHLELSRQLLQAQKMEAIGTLAGGVAHDFNNILQVALGYSELLMNDEEMPPRYRTDLEKINESVRRGADLVKRLLTFSRKTETQPQPINLNRRINEMRKMLDRTIKPIEIQHRLADGLAAINADPTQVDQVLLNLALNARDAMSDGGRLIIETANIILDEEYARTHLDAMPGRYVLLTVGDTGTGMDKETLDHIYEPFYTTKETGKGTGLGLAVVHGIVRQNGGHIRCYSEPGQGTTFNIYFPALVSEEENGETTAEAIPTGGSETILLVDDEEMVRDFCSRVFTKAGYIVIKASNGREALEVYQARHDKIALVILDLIMPEMGGKQCLEGLLSLNPAVKVIIASGFSANGPAKDSLAAGAKAVVKKPYNIRQVLKMIRNVLDTD